MRHVSAQTGQPPALREAPESVAPGEVPDPFASPTEAGSGALWSCEYAGTAIKVARKMPSAMRMGFIVCLRTGC